MALADIAVVAFELLLGTQLLAEVGQFAAAAVSVLTRAIFAFVDGTFGASPDVLAETAINLVLGADALRHSGTPFDITKLRWSAPSSAHQGRQAGTRSSQPRVRKSNAGPKRARAATIYSVHRERSIYPAYCFCAASLTGAPPIFGPLAT